MLKPVEHYYAELKEKSPVEWTFKVLNASFTCEEMRERTGRTIKELDNKQCFELVKRFAGTQIHRRTHRRSLKNRKKYIRFGEFGHICKMHYMETGEFSPRTKEPKYDFTAIFDEVASIDYWLYVRLGMFNYRKPKYYRLRGATQLIIRSIGWIKRPTDVKLEWLVKIAGINDTNINRQQQKVEAHLLEAKIAGFICDWDKKVERVGIGGHMDINYRIFKAENGKKAEYNKGKTSKRNR